MGRRLVLWREAFDIMVDGEMRTAVTYSAVEGEDDAEE